MTLPGLSTQGIGHIQSHGFLLQELYLCRQGLEQVVGKFRYVCSDLPQIEQDWIHVAGFDEGLTPELQEECVSVRVPLRLSLEYHVFLLNHHGNLIFLLLDHRRDLIFLFSFLLEHFGGPMMTMMTATWYDLLRY